MVRLAIAISLMLPMSGMAESQVGNASVIDGDTLKINGITHRLRQIDAPEMRQTCRKEGVEWLCGAESAEHLRKIIRSRQVYCESESEDQYGRRLSECFVGKRNLNAEMVGSGYALAYRKYGDEYVEYELHARKAEIGLWSGTFIEPWRYRTGEGQADEEGCRIKGNINREGRKLYHKPGDRSYGNTVISPEKGEQWFCTSEEARSAGWQPAWP